MDLLLLVLSIVAVLAVEEAEERTPNRHWKHEGQVSGGQGDVRQQRALEKLKQVFGLTEHRGKHRHHAPPQFMTELYNTIAGTDGVTRGRHPYNATVVRSYVERDNFHPQYFYFNISGLDPAETVLEAELHIFKVRVPLSEMHPSVFTSPYYLIRVYQVQDERSLHTADLQKLLSVHYVGAHTWGWQVFNVKRAVLDWVTGASSNRGLLVTASTLFGDHVQVKFSRRDEHRNSKQPILVLFDRDVGETMPSAGHGRREQPAYPEYHKYQSEFSANEVQDFRLRRRKRSTNDTGRACARRQLYVSFELIGWSSWIISPKGYSAYYCDGECNFPLGQSLEPTNHATVQSIVHELGLDSDVGKPCCVPTNLLAVSILYFDEHGNVVLKFYDDMVAETCGCH